MASRGDCFDDAVAESFFSTTADETGRGRVRRPWHGVTGASFERTLGNLDAKCQSAGLNGCSPRHLAPLGGGMPLTR